MQAIKVKRLQELFRRLNIRESLKKELNTKFNKGEKLNVNYTQL